MMMLKVFDYFFLVKTLTKKQKQLYQKLLESLHRLIPFNSKLSQRIYSSIQSKLNFFDDDLDGKVKTCAPLELYLI